MKALQRQSFRGRSGSQNREAPRIQMPLHFTFGFLSRPTKLRPLTHRPCRFTPSAARASLCLALLCSGAWAQSSGPEWHEESGYAWKSLVIRDSTKPGFSRLSATQTGVLFTNSLDDWSATANRVLELGSGVAAGDYDGDGLADLFFCSLSGDCNLYKNLGGFRFKDVTAEAGIVCTNYICRGAVFADIDGDGHLDLLISTCGHGVRCFRNEGNGHFADFTPVARTASPFGATTLALADIDGNGTLDLYVANYRTNDIRDAPEVQLLSAH